MSRLPRIVSRIAAGTFSLVLTLGASPADGPLRSNPAYEKLLRWNTGFDTSVADVAIRTQLRSFPFLSFTFHGHLYFKAPGQQAIVLDDVPDLMRGLVKDSPMVDPSPVWPERYDATLSGDDGKTTTFHLVPKDSQSHIASIDAAVADDTGFVARYTFTNKNGSTVTTAQTYEQIGPREAVASQVGYAHGRGYSAQITTTFSNYRFDVPVSDDVFEKR